MPYFSPTSLSNLKTCDRRLQTVFLKVVETIDCAILEGHRDRETQDAAFRQGRSQLRWPQSRHNHLPSLAVDAAPYPLDWRDRERFSLFAGFVLAEAARQGVKLRWGGDWDGDFDLKDNRFDDLPHFELMETGE